MGEVAAKAREGVSGGAITPPRVDCLHFVSAIATTLPIEGRVKRASSPPRLLSHPAIDLLRGKRGAWSVPLC